MPQVTPGARTSFARHERTDFLADLGDFAGDIAAGNVGERDSNTGEAAANPEVEMIEGAGADANQDFIVAEGRFWGHQYSEEQKGHRVYG